MRDKLYVTNFPADITEDELRALFGEFGEVTGVDFDIEDKNGEPYAVVYMASEKVATKANNNLNGYPIGDRRLAVSYPEVDTAREITSKQRRTFEDILATLDETEKVPIRRIEAMIYLCGLSFVEALVEEALEMEAGDSPLMLGDESRKRTKGGHFFYLARFRMAPPVRRIIYNRKGKFPSTDEQAG